MTRANAASSVAARKSPASRQKKPLAALSPTAGSPEVMLPVVALDEIEAATMPPADTADAAEKKKDKPKAKKQKLVRDSFTMPEEEYAALGELKKECIRAGVAVKKSELLRVAVSQLRKMDAAQLKQALDGLAPVKAGRPSKQK
ncbi:MAG: hypothetical protein ABWY05_02765 [Noviherbaspirillum sp.]